MNNMQVIKGQRVASTLTDSQGEKLSLENLQKLLEMSNAQDYVLLGDEHDLAKRHKGYIKNFRIVKSETEKDEYHLIADVYCQDVANWSSGGFSWSLIEHFPNQDVDSELHVFLPYPYYNENDYLTELKSHDGYALGSWKKKSADPTIIGLIYNSVALFLTPIWNSIYKNQVEPRLIDLFEKIFKNKPESLKYDLIQNVMHPQGYVFKVYFLLSKADLNISVEQFRLRYGVEIVRQYIENTTDNNRISMIIMRFVDENSGFQIWSIEYQDGNKVYFTEDY